MLRDLKKRKLVVVVAVVLLAAAVFGALAVANHFRTPYDCLISRSFDEEQNATSLLAQNDLGNGEYILFYVNENSNTACAIVKKGLVFNEILDISAELPFDGELADDEDSGEDAVPAEDSADYLLGSYGNGAKWLLWGVIRDSQTRQILVDNRKANIVDIPPYGIRLYYLLGDGASANMTPKVKMLK
jgi:hypothetical protein